MEKRKKGETVKVKIVDMADSGAGIGKDAGFAVFVPGAVTGDAVTARLSRVKKNFAEGELISVEEPSKDRREPFCPAAGECGGCPFGTLAYEAQAEIRKKHLSDRLERIGGARADGIASDTVTMEEPFRYRNKAVMEITAGGLITLKGGIQKNAGEPVIGFHRRGSHDVVDCGDCMLQAPTVAAAARAVKEFMISDNITAYDPKWEKGLMRHMMIRTAFGTGEVMAVFVINGKGIPNAQKLIGMLDDAIYDLPPGPDGTEYSLESVVVSCKKGNGRGSVFGDEFTTVAGSPVIHERIGGLDFEISPASFYQVNPVQMESLYDIAADFAGGKEGLSGKTVLDLYCGVGSIGLWLARKGAGTVIGIESVRDAVLDANRNAVINGIVNARYICGKAEEVLPRLAGGEEVGGITLEKADIAVLDPPRAGCREELLDAVAKAGAKRIVYVSCDSATLSRDVKYLSGLGYVMTKAVPVDMFPHTAESEAVALLEKKQLAPGGEVL